MTSDLDSSRISSGDRARVRAYHWDFWPGITGYGVVLTAVLLWGDLDGPSPWRFLWAGLPVIPALWIVRAVVRHVHRVDDYQRLLLVQSLGVGFAIAMIAAVTAGLLGGAGLPMQSAGWAIYGAGMLGWIVASHLLPKR